MTDAAVFARVRALLHAAGIRNAAREATWLAESVSGRRAPGQVMDPWLDLDFEERFLELARRRASGEPLQYLTGVAGFGTLEVSVGPGVFIPRPETESVAERALELLPADGVAVDVGTGSGAIALAIAAECPRARVYATDSSPIALRWAAKNRDALGVRVEIVGCDLLAGLPAELRAAVDVVVSNPPYIDPTEASDLPTDVVDHEPHEALFAPGEGLSVVRRLAVEAWTWLRPGGWFVVEIGATQGQAATEVLAAADYEKIAIRPDPAGRDRIAEGRRPPG